MRTRMQNSYPADNRMVINCVHCNSKLRVPLDKGKITVACPVCRREFVYNPDSILDTLKQIFISTRATVTKSRKNLIIFIVAVLIILAVLFIAFFRPSGGKDPGENSLIQAYDTRQEYYVS